MYLWIVLGSLLIGGLVAFYMLSQYAGRQANAMRDRGISEEEISLWYKQIGPSTVRALIKSTFITGGFIAAVACLIYWLAIAA